jgi:hypothetical protein
MDSIEWVQLNKSHPKEEDIYKTFRYDYNKFVLEYLLWTGMYGFQPLNYGDRETYPINMNVTHWLRIKEPPVPQEDARKLLITTEVFFMEDGLISFTKENGILEYEKYGNAIEYVTTGVGDNIMRRMRQIFKSNGVHKNILKTIRPKQ